MSDNRLLPFQPPLASRFNNHHEMLTYALNQLTELESYYEQRLNTDLSDAHIEDLQQELHDTEQRLYQLEEEEREKRLQVKTEAESDRLEADAIREILKLEGLQDETSEYDEENPEIE